MLMGNVCNLKPFFIQLILSIYNRSNCYVMPSPKDERIPLLNIDGCDGNVLEYEFHFTPLYQKLGFKQLSFETAYQELICDQFEFMSDETLLQHLEALAIYWLKQRSAGKNLKFFLDFLKDRPLIRPKGNSQELVRPAEVFSSRPNLFKTFKELG